VLNLKAMRSSEMLASCKGKMSGEKERKLKRLKEGRRKGQPWGKREGKTKCRYGREFLPQGERRRKWVMTKDREIEIGGGKRGENQNCGPEAMCCIGEGKRGGKRESNRRQVERGKEDSGESSDRASGEREKKEQRNKRLRGGNSLALGEQRKTRELFNSQEAD